MSADYDTVPFMILATIGHHSPFRRPFFVRAKSIREAYEQVLKDPVFQQPLVHLEAFVVSAADLAEVLPLKSVTKFYWNLGKTQEFPTFEEAWEAHGAEPDDVT